jgi:two-component system, LytTR family, response regulator
MINKKALVVKRKWLQKLSVPTVEGFEFIDTDTILYLQAEANYTQLFLTDNCKLISSKNLGYFEAALSQKPFLRIHHSTIVNLQKVIRYTKGDDGWVTLITNTSLKVARSKKEALLFCMDATNAADN